MMRLQISWRGWVTVALALSLAAAVILADIQIQHTVKLVHAAAVADADEGRASLQDIDDLVGRTLAAIELSVLAADSAGNVTLDTQTKRKLALEVDAIAAAAEFDLAVALDRTIDLDARLDTLRVLSATPAQRLITPDVISLRGTVAEAASTANALLADEGTLTSEQINSMRGRLGSMSAPSMPSSWPAWPCWRSSGSATKGGDLQCHLRPLANPRRPTSFLS